jgi:hypothetical protein
LSSVWRKAERRGVSGETIERLIHEIKVAGLTLTRVWGFFNAALGGLDKWKTPSRGDSFLQGRGTWGIKRKRIYLSAWYPVF